MKGRGIQFLQAASLNTPEMVAKKKVESCPHQIQFEDRDLVNLEDACVSPILDKKYDKVGIEKLMKEHCFSD